jgi:hypothetical protein
MNKKLGIPSKHGIGRCGIKERRKRVWQAEICCACDRFMKKRGLVTYNPWK